MERRDVPIDQIKLPVHQPPTREALGDLPDRLTARGLLHPPVVYPDLTLLVGRKRYWAARALGWSTIPVLILPTLESLANGVIAHLDIERGYDLLERAKIARAILEQKREEARQRKLSTLKRGQQSPDSVEFPERGESRDLAAKAVQIGSGRQLEKILEIVDAADKNPECQLYLDRLQASGRVNGCYKGFQSWKAEQRVKGEMPQRIVAGRYKFAIDSLVCGDAFDMLPAVAAATTDGCLLDPPYGCGIKYDDFTEPYHDPDAYWNGTSTWKGLKKLAEECLRILKPGGFFFCFQSQVYFPYFWDWFAELGVARSHINIFVAARNWIPYRKYSSASRLMRAYDPCICFYKSGATAVGPSVRGRNRDFNVSSMRFDELAHWDVHPCVKGFDVIRFLIDNFVPQHGLVLDPTCGLGTIPITCKLLGRHYVGIDQSPKYVRIAKQRMKLFQSWEDVDRMTARGGQDTKEDKKAAQREQS